MTVFMLSMILLYLASTVYHTFDVNGKVNRRLKKFDHMMISVLIAGSYTDLPDCTAWTDGNCTLCTGVGGSDWRDSRQGILDQLSEVVFFGAVYRNGLAVRSGVSSGLFLAPRGRRLDGCWPAGIIYTVGGVIYSLKMPVFNAKHKKFGTHEIFHLFVMGGSFCHFIVMYYFVAAMPV